MTHISDILSDHQQSYFTNTVQQGNTAEENSVISHVIKEKNTESGSDIYSSQSTAHDEQERERLRSMIYAMKDQLDAMLRVLNGQTGGLENLHTTHKEADDTRILETGERIIEGVFNGEKMVGSDGKEYAVPPNYASKSKLVEGDILKLTITNNGKFIYKQINPIERKTISGELTCDAQGRWGVVANSRSYRVLKASITFYKGQSGDECFILVPSDGEAGWGAVEQIIHRQI